MGEAFPRRLGICSDELRLWGGTYAKQLTTEIRDIQLRLNGLRDCRSEGTLAEFRRLDSRLHCLWDQQNIYWRQRAKQHWLLAGDRNTKFFHSYASARKKKNSISKLQSSSGNWVEGEVLLGLASDYFTDIFNSRGMILNSLLDDFAPKVSAEDNMRLLLPFTIEEVKDALFSMAPDKSPGPDGYSPAFYQHFWKEIGQDIAQFIIECVNTGSFPLGFNDANITLVPKKAIPISMGDLRPIALCNVAYKVMSKMLANRLKVILEGIISISQSAFIPGRLISDNVLIVAEVVHYLNRKREGITGWAALKLDMAKAYDKMEWGFLREIMVRLGFDNRWIELIMRCVSSVWYKVGVNVAFTDFIIPSRGLRQGDPLSPYLLISLYFVPRACPIC